MSKRLDGRTFGVTLDPGFKRLLKNEVAMVSFLNAILHSDDEIKKKNPSNDPKDIAEREKRCYEIPFVFAVWICNFPINSDKNYRDAWRIYSENSIAKNAPHPVTEKIKYIIIDLVNFTKTADELETVEAQVACAIHYFVILIILHATNVEPMSRTAHL